MKLHIKEFYDDYEYSTYSINYLTYYLAPDDYGCDDYYVIEDTDYEYMLDRADVFKSRLDKDLAAGKYPGIWIHNIVIEAECKRGRQIAVDDFIDDDVKILSENCYSDPVTDFAELSEYIPNVMWVKDEETMEWFEQGVETYKQSKKK